MSKAYPHIGIIVPANNTTMEPEIARAAGYRKVRLWTNSVLVDARRLYEKAGFRLVESEPYHAFGHDLVSEFWEVEV